MFENSFLLKKYYRIVDKINNNKTFIFLIGIVSIIYILPILLANTYYVDDLNRTVEGYDWEHDGRFSSSFIMHLLSFQSEIVYSLFPFSNISSVLILSLSGFILCYAIGVRNKTQLFIGSLILTTCPFILEILVYRFDCIPISLSFLCVVLPFLFYKNKKIFFITSLLGVLLSLSFYQTTALSYCIILCFFLIKDIWNNEFRNVIINGVLSFISFILGFLSYQTLVKILKLELLKDDRGSFVFKDENLKQVFKDRYVGLQELVGTLTNSSYRYTLYCLLTFSAIGLLIYLKTNVKKYFNNILIFKVVAVSILSMLIIIFAAGINMVVYEPRWVPRGMIGWGFAIYAFYFLIIINKETFFKNVLLVTAFTPMIYYSFIISSQLGMYLKNQDEFSDFIINLVSPKLVDYERVKVTEHQRIKLVIKGTIKRAHRNNTVNDKTMPFINKLAPVYENNGWGWGIIRMNKFNNIASEYIGGEKREQILKNIDDYPVIDRNIYYTLRLKNDIAIIDFDNE